MNKVVHYENYRVEIVPRRLGDFGIASVSDSFFGESKENIEAQYRARCHEIAESVNRHVDNIGIAHVVFDTVATCKHCGHAWTEESNEYNGGCCAKDQDAEDLRQATATTP